MPPKQKSARQSQPPASPLKTGYLVLYNALSACAWAAVLSRTIKTTTSEGPESVFDRDGEFTKWVQTGALLEVLHSLFGVVRAPLQSTVMQVASRILLVWGIGEHFPEAAQHWAYATMLVAWSVTEVIRYSYFALNLSASPPYFLSWLRYNTFFVLYPMGISSECWLINRSREPAAQISEWVVYGLWAILAVYVPGSYILFTHMMSQRKKALRALKEKKV